MSTNKDSPVSYGGRGALLEEMVNLTNISYRNRHIAMVQKIPTPITATQMSGSAITHGFFTEKSTVDYIGVCGGTALCFDAKECRHTTFPLKNIHDHQVAFMRDFEANGGTAFLILYFLTEDRLYWMPLSELEEYLERSDGGGRKSFRMDELMEEHFFQSSDVPVPYVQFIYSSKNAGKESKVG